ncbi:sugar-binding protein [Halobacillus salinus]|nr:sugar-binding protein [Halobacillus salinus]
MKTDKWIYTFFITAVVLSAGMVAFYAVKAFAHTGEWNQVSSEPLEGLHYVLIPQETDNDYWRLIEKGARKAEQEENITLEYNGPAKSDMADHIEWIEKAIASRVDGIITQGLQDELFRPVINKAIDKGIPVITIDTDAPSSERSAYVGTDNYEAGFLAGEALIEDTNGQAKVGIITGSFDAENMQLRVQGFNDALKKAPGIEVLDTKSSDIKRIQAAQKTNQMMAEHPEINAFFGTSALDSFGIVSTLQQRGWQDDFYIIGFDTLPETIDLIEEGKVDATVVQHPFEMGYESVKKLKELSQNKPVGAINHTTTSILRKQDLTNQKPFYPEIGEGP